MPKLLITGSNKSTSLYIYKQLKKNMLYLIFLERAAKLNILFTIYQINMKSKISFLKLIITK
jgi:hypothetical protein